MKRISAYTFGLALTLPFAAHSAAPADYLYGAELTPETATDGGMPLQEITLPDAVYASIRHADLSDLRVFNAEQLPVPHALCGPLASQPAPRDEVPLRIFPLKASAPANTGSHTHVDIETSGQVELNIKPESAAAESRSSISAYVIDARAAQQELHALYVDWSSTDGASEVQVRVEASEDLDQWRTLVRQTTLLHADANGRRLERVRIPLPASRYQYLRLQRSDSGAQPELKGVNGEIVVALKPQPLRWTASQAMPAKEPKTFLFDAGRLAPMTAARVRLPSPNMSLGVRLSSRGDATSVWHEVWSGTVFSLQQAAGQQRSNADIPFSANSHRWWQLVVVRGSESLAAAPLNLELGYWPGRLRFLAQGAAPYLLAYGSERAERYSSMGCDALLESLGQTQLAGLLGISLTAAPHSLGGEQALKAPPDPGTARKLGLWFALMAGVLLLVGMSLGLLKRLRDTPPPD